MAARNSGNSGTVLCCVASALLYCWQLKLGWYPVTERHKILAYCHKTISARIRMDSPLALQSTWHRCTYLNARLSFWQATKTRDKFHIVTHKREAPLHNHSSSTHRVPAVIERRMLHQLGEQRGFEKRSQHSVKLRTQKA